MVLADPRYGYGVQPQNVIGVSLLLRDRRTGDVTTARKLISEGRYDPAALLDHELTHTLWAPLPWYEGKQAAIHTYIHPWKKPVLVAGDTPHSDGPMFFRAADVEQGGLRLFELAREAGELASIEVTSAPRAFSSFRRRVELNGKIHYRRDGTPLSIEASELDILPEDDELPSAADVRGILAS